MTPRRQYLTVELEGCAVEQLNDPARMEAVCTQAVRLLCADAVLPVFHTCTHGVSGALISPELHLSIHSWSQTGVCTADILTCRTDLRWEDCWQFLKQALQASRATVRKQSEAIGLAPTKPGAGAGGDDRSGSAFWFRESIAGGEEVHYLCDRRIYSGRSSCQQIDIVDTRLHGRMLFLDGVAQSSEMDEFVYHEMLVHPALFSHPKPKSVLVIGGATGATLREIFRHPEIRRVVMVDIDGALVELCKRFLPSWHRHSFDDLRLELIIGDGREYVEKCCETFDVAILDLSDPIEGTPALPLYTREFYQSLRGLLSPAGAFSMQGEGTSPQQASLHAKIVNTLRSIFPAVHPYTYTLHSFHRPDAHILATLDPEWSVEALLIRAEKGCLDSRYFSPEIAGGMFRLPPYLHRVYEIHDRIILDEDLGLEEHLL
jgi:spermidine synthase